MFTVIKCLFKALICFNAGLVNAIIYQVEPIILEHEVLLQRTEPQAYLKDSSLLPGTRTRTCCLKIRSKERPHSGDLTHDLQVAFKLLIK